MYELSDEKAARALTRRMEIEQEYAGAQGCS
jgi:hypothetical protein